ncbi:hypothetical protein DPMN_032613 [Dreissena polymorpha]|uniref:Uncharacterized protein n=1 Tax=Dreissena polymorpha TaxID=45954 RepID=A0A9D4RI45_DREPO|nr:hypothetical protein DPMN_032613 [Dreissena polymorpha]
MCHYGVSTSTILIRVHTVSLKIQNDLVNFSDYKRALGKTYAIPCHGVPLADSEEIAFFGPSGFVFQYRSIINERVDFSVLK